MIRRSALHSSTSEESVTKEDDDERQRENVDAQVLKFRFINHENSIAVD